MATNLKPMGFHLKKNQKNKKTQETNEKQADLFDNISKHASSTFRFLRILTAYFFKQTCHHQ